MTDTPDFTETDFTQHSNVLEYLTTYGYHHLLDIESDEAMTIDEQSTDYRLMLAKHQASYATMQGIDPDGKIGPRTREMLNRPRCGCPDIAQRGGGWDDPCRLSLQVYCSFPGLKENDTWNQDSYEQAWYDCFAESRRVCEIDFKRVESSSEAHYYAYSGRTSGSTLAWSEFPSSCSGRSESLFGSKWDWSKSGWLDTALHEIGHGLGLDHGAADEVMFWTTSDQDYYGKWQPGDIRKLRRIYGEPTWTPPTDPDPEDPTTPPTLELPITLYISPRGILWAPGEGKPTIPGNPTDGGFEL